MGALGDPGQVRLRRDGAVAVLVLDHPARRNAITAAMRAQLAELLDELADDPDVRAVVLTGQGDTFSAGMDITELTPDTTPRVSAELVELERAIERLPVPVLAAVAGACVGAGLQLALACDLRLCDATARFALTPARLGVLFPPDSVQRLVRTLGPATASRLLLTAQTLDAAQGAARGLADLVDGVAVEQAALELAATVASCSPTTVRAAKQMIGLAATHGRVPEAHRVAWTRAAAGDDDLVEGLAAFAQRRPPRFAPDGPAPQVLARRATPDPGVEHR